MFLLLDYHPPSPAEPRIHVDSGHEIGSQSDTVLLTSWMLQTYSRPLTAARKQFRLLPIKDGGEPNMTY